MEDVYKIIKTLTNWKAPVPEGITPGLVKYGLEKLFPVMHNILQRTINEEIIHPQLEEA